MWVVTPLCDGMPARVEGDRALCGHPPRKTANTAQSAELAGVTRRTIYNWVKANRVEWFRTPGGQIRIYVDTLSSAPKA